MKLLIDRTAAQHYEDPATGLRYFSWSQVADVLDPHAYTSIEPKVLAASRMRGTRLHFLFAFLLAHRAGLCEPPDVPVEWQGYYAAMARWAASHQVRPVLLEESSIHPKMGYAGTPDAKVLCGPQEIVTLVDLKTGSIRSRLHRVQVQAYREMDGYSDCQSMQVLYIQPDAGYEAVTVRKDPADWAWFQCGLGVLRGRLQ